MTFFPSLCSLQEWHSGKWICSALPAVGSNDFLVSKPGFLAIKDFAAGKSMEIPRACFML